MTDKTKRSDDKLKGTKDRSSFGHSSNQKMPENVDKSIDKSRHWENSHKGKPL